MSRAWQAAANFDGQGFWLAIAAAGTIVLCILMRPKKKSEPLAPPRFPLAQQREVEEQMNNLLVELSRMAQQITSQLDTRALKLQILIKDADERLAALRGVGQALMTSPPPAPSDNPMADHHASDAEVAALHAPDTVANPGPVTDARYLQVYAMADEGHSAPEIAKLVQRPAGEVELILALRPH